MTPLQLFLVSLVVMVFCYILDYDGKAKNHIKNTGGFSIFLMFISIIWGIFYYIKI